MVMLISGMGIRIGMGVIVFACVVMLIVSMGIRIDMGVLVFGGMRVVALGSVRVGMQGQSHAEDALSEEG